MSAIRAVSRVLQALRHGVAGWWIIRTKFPALSQAERDAHVHRWALGMLRAMGIELRLRGQAPADGPVLLVANHISWLDILVMHAARYCRFVAKSDVKQWPLLGTLATGGGTLYIERESRRDAMRIVHRMAQALREGEILAVFPEGTTSDGRALLPFHGNLIQAAISADVPVQPVALSFVSQASGATVFTPSYIGDETLVASVWRTLAGEPVAAVVTYGQPQSANGRDRRVWAADLHAEVERLRAS